MLRLSDDHELVIRQEPLHAKVSPVRERGMSSSLRTRTDFDVLIKRLARSNASSERKPIDPPALPAVSKPFRRPGRVAQDQNRKWQPVRERKVAIGVPEPPGPTHIVDVLESKSPRRRVG